MPMDALLADARRDCLPLEPEERFDIRTIVAMMK